MDTDGDEKELIKELGDVLEVIDHLIEAFNLKKEDIEKTKQEKREERGGFDKRLFLEYTEQD